MKVFQSGGCYLLCGQVGSVNGAFFRGDLCLLGAVAETTFPGCRITWSSCTWYFACRGEMNVFPPVKSLSVISS